MPAPNDASVFGSELHILASEVGTLWLSDALVDLFIQSRERYAWPKKQTAQESQKEVIDIEQQFHSLTANVDDENAQLIVQRVSTWGGNNATAKHAIRCASQAQKHEFARLILELLSPSTIKSALRRLAGQPGVDLVMATKIYRFCVPRAGAALDRHCSYFSNPLWDRRVPEAPRACTQFRREWTNGKHNTTRLATFSKTVREWNLDQYLDCYLPLLEAIAGSLNSRVGGFRCAASANRKAWRPADVEMAAYQWWSRNGPR
jgi:hypothetical protein